MPEPSRLTQDVQRANPKGECGQPVGQLNIKLSRSFLPFETVSFYCNKTKLHLDECAFVGVELVVTRRRRA